MSELKGKTEADKIYFWTCDGKSQQAPHPSTSYKVETLQVEFEGNGIKTKIDKVTRLWIFDGEVYDLMLDWKAWMKEERYKRLQVPI